jgi:hyperosmotically inducible periplasmic protein
MGHLIRTLFVLAIVAIVGAYFLGYLPQTASVFGPAPAAKAPAAQDVEAPRGTPPAKPQPSGDELKDRAARAAQRVDETLAEAALTGKIKAKIALDDTVKTADVRVHSQKGIVTLSGSVNSAAQRDRLLQLARETAGVNSVVNQITIAGSRS